MFRSRDFLCGPNIIRLTPGARRICLLNTALAAPACRERAGNAVGNHKRRRAARSNKLGRSVDDNNAVVEFFERPPFQDRLLRQLLGVIRAALPGQHNTVVSHVNFQFANQTMRAVENGSDELGLK